MAKLTFSKLYTSDMDDLTGLCIGNEPNNVITKFFIESQRQRNRAGAINLSNYDAIAWNPTDTLMTSQDVISIGIKTFPQIGSIGFYRLKHEPKSLIIAPVHSGQHMRNRISISAYVVGDELHIDIGGAEENLYDCYRVVVRNGYFAEEYITYERHIVIPTPTDVGTYAITVTGYVDEVRASNESYAVYLIRTDGDAELLSDENGNVLQFGNTLLSV